MAALTENFHWMGINIFLALLGPLFCALLIRAYGTGLQYLFGVLWLLFIPNTIYLLTDIEYLAIQLQRLEGGIGLVLLYLLQYAILFIVGIVTYIYGVLPLELSLKKRKKALEKTITTGIIILNFLIAFGVVLGKLQRRNSWEAFTNLPRTLHDSFVVLTTPQALWFGIAFGLITNVVYFTLRQHFAKNSMVKQIMGSR